MTLNDISVEAYDYCIGNYGNEFVERHHQSVYDEIKSISKQFFGTTQDERNMRTNEMYKSYMEQINNCLSNDVKPLGGLENSLPNFANLD